ncbi:glutamate-rich protein 3 isoform X2 [Poecilia reticulata]|uniref:Glutamate rich 3 n=1 Tax=Poecilia reticulata TaxID=8081 RepID=A0A3P9NZZ5_POERE|nr:PREDICTED: glutamate-rich protein 3 isoform X2 [Poecilia reticulata]
MKHFTSGFFPAYNSLTDKHLADYFSNSRIRKHLVGAGLITRSGRIVPEKEYRHKLIQTTNQNHVQECLAQAIVHKVLEREHYHQIIIKRKQLEYEKKQRVQRCKVERCKKYEEEMIRALTPCPPTVSKSIWEQLSGPLGKHFEACDIPRLIRPSTAPGKMQRPVRLKPIHKRSSTAIPRHISPYRKSSSFLESQPLNCLANFKSRRRFTIKDIPGLDSFRLPVTKNFVIPVPPAEPPTGAPSSTIRGRRLRPSTSPSGVEDPSRLKGSVHQSRVRVTMVYFGKPFHLSDNPAAIRDEIRVLQQHCGGENLCVFQGQLREGDVFQFLSRRHRGYPFSLTFYQNRLLVERLSSCCEYKHSKGSRIGGRNGLFGFSSMEGATPCYRCIIAMGMDRLPIPPPKKVKGDPSRKLSAASLEDEPGKESDASEVEALSDQKYESCQTPEMVSTAREQSATSLKDENEMEADTTEEGAVSKQEYESYQSPEMDTTAIEQSASVESNIINDYEEDFEADNESSMEETTPQEMKSQIQVEACEIEEEEVYSEENRSRSVSAMSGRHKEISGETTISSEDEEREDNTNEDNQVEAAAPVSKKVKWINEETTPGIDEPASVNNSELLDSAMDSTGIEIADTGVLLGNDSELCDPSEGKYVEDSESEIKTEDEVERAKSVQEKLAEAVLKESQSSSEPEPSDTSTEEEEVPVDKAPDKENKEHLKVLVEETNCEENVTNEVAEEQKVFTEAEEEEDKVSDHGDNTQEERVGEVGEDGKPTQDEVRTQGDKSEEPGKAHVPIDGDVAQDVKIEDPFEISELADVEASHNDEEKVEKGSAKPDSQHDESGQRANSREEDESSVLEPSERVDEPEVPDIAEAEVTSETMETKAESSEEQEALSREEALETSTDKMQSDSEEAQVAAENSSRSPEECGDSTAEETVDMHVGAVKTQSINDNIYAETKQQLSRAEGQDDSQEENWGVKEEYLEVHETAERQSFTHLEEITEAENKAEKINDESKVDESNEQTKNLPEGTECEEIQDEENKDEIRETEKDAKDEEDMDKISWGKPEAKRDDKGQASEEGNETKKVLREKDDEAGMSENGEKEKVEGNKTDDEYEDMTNNSVAEEREMSETTEVPEKNQDVDLDTQKMKASSEKIAESEKVSESKAAEGTEMHLPNLAVSEAETGEREAEKESESGEIDAENGESSSEAEREPQEDEENAVTSDEKRQTDEPDEEIESTEVKGVVKESGDDAEKQEDSLTDQAPETGAPESDAEEADSSMMKNDEAASRVSEPETFGAEIQEERNANEEVGEVEIENKVYNLILSNNESDIGEVSPLSEISSAADVEETAKQKDEGTSRSITDKPLETGENGEDTEEVSKASEEGASVLLKPLDPNTEGEDVVGEGNPEALAKDDNTDMVTNWIQMHQTSKFFETFVEPLEDLRDEVPDAQVSNPNGEEKQSAELLRPESATKMGRISEDGDIEDSRNETQTKANEGGLQGSEEAGKKSPETNKETDQHDSRGSQDDDKENQEGNTPFTTEVETFSSSLKVESDFENQSSGNTNSGPGLIVKQTATDPSFKPEQSNSLNTQGDTDDISRDGRQTTQITKLTTSHSADGSQEESHDEDVQTKILERRFSGEIRDVQIIEDIKHTLSKERLNTFSLFGHTSYPLLTTSGSDGGQ